MENLQGLVWTINLKSFEIPFDSKLDRLRFTWTINLKSFEIKVKDYLNTRHAKWTINLKSFEIILLLHNGIG